ncbi:MAG: response regulator transcription factor [Fusobacteriaceae bacterium]
MKVLIVEDDIEIQNLVAFYFQKEGYEVEVASDGIEGMKILKKNHHDLIILDLMLPNLDGKNFVKIIRSLSEEYGNPKIIILSAKGEIEDVLEGLTFGADDYMKKPFDPRELILRAQKLLANNSSNSSLDTKNKNSKNLKYNFEKIFVDEEKRLVKFEEKEIDLSKKEYDLLLLLLNNIGIVLTREKILDMVWGTDYFSGDRSVDVYISKLREKLPTLTKSLKTLKGVGYKLEEKK